MDVNGISPVQNLILKVLPASPAEKVPSPTGGNGKAPVLTSQEGPALAPAESPNTSVQNIHTRSVLTQSTLSQTGSLPNLPSQGATSQGMSSLNPMTQNEPSQTPSTQNEPSQTPSTQNVAPQSTLIESVPLQNPFSQSLPPQNIVSHNVQPQGVPSQNASLQNLQLPELPLLALFTNVVTSEIQGSNVQALSTMFRKLGLDYEKRLWKALSLTEPFQSQEFADLKDTVKAQLIDAARKDPEAKSALDTLTSMQLKHSSEQDSQAYLVMDLPYLAQDKGHQARIAIHGNKKGKTIDAEHCRLGLSTVTDVLGEIVLMHCFAIAL